MMTSTNKENDETTELNSPPSSDLQGLILDNIGSGDSTLVSDLVSIEDKLKESTEQSQNDLTNSCPTGDDDDDDNDHKLPCSVCPEGDAQKGSDNEKDSAQDTYHKQSMSGDPVLSDKDTCMITTQNDKDILDITTCGDEQQPPQNVEVLMDSNKSPDDASVVERSKELDVQVDTTVVNSYERVDDDKISQIPIVAESPPPAIGSTSSTAATVSTSQPRQIPSEQSIYKIKMIKWKDTSIPIVTQNENGPCPLIAIINVLLARAKVNPFGNKTEIKAEDLLSYLGECMLLNAPKNISKSAQLNYEQNIQDAFSVFPKIQSGLDVNVKFTGVRDFEYTTECIIFDLLNIHLYHGWLVDPQAIDVVTAVKKLSYNQLVEKIITNKCSSNSDLVTEALIAETFLERTASQLTYHGLYELNSIMKPDELAVLFRNNHFITIYKHKDELFQLVTDQGFLNESNVVWETLSNIEGDGLFVDSNFVTVPPKPQPVGISSTATLDEVEQIQQDFLVALSLQEEQKREEEKAMVWQQYKEKELGATSEMTDEELARRMQEEEQKHAEQLNAEYNRVGSPGSSSNPPDRNSSLDNSGRRVPTSPKKKDRDCKIL